MLSLDLLQLSKDIASILKTLKESNPELDAKFAELRTSLLEMYEENMELRTQLGVMEEKLSVKSNFVWDNDLCVYWIGTVGNDGPYCQRCKDADGKLIRLFNLNDTRWACRVCKNGYMKPGGIKVETQKEEERAKAYVKQQNPFIV